MPPTTRILTWPLDLIPGRTILAIENHSQAQNAIASDLQISRALPVRLGHRIKWRHVRSDIKIVPAAIHRWLVNPHISAYL
jgi:hypothetical protein